MEQHLSRGDETKLDQNGVQILMQTLPAREGLFPTEGIFPQTEPQLSLRGEKEGASRQKRIIMSAGGRGGGGER